MKLKPIIPSRTKEYIINGLIMFFFIIVMIMLTVVILAQFKDDYEKLCCEGYNATYIFYECQCNAMMPCDNLKCGSYCEYDDGTLIKIELLNCERNAT